MRKMIATSLVVAHVLAGCGVSTGNLFTAEAPTRERTIGQSTNGQQRTVLPMAKVLNGTYLGKDDPARHGMLRPKDAVGGAAPSGEAVQLAAAEATGRLALVKGPGDLKVAPVLDSEGGFERLMFSPTSGELTWTVKAVGGAIGVSTVRLTLQSTASYPAGTSAELETEAGTPATVELETSELGWPEALRSGGEAKLAFDFKSAAVREYLEANARAARVAVTVELLDRDGAPVVDDQDQPSRLKTTVQVM